MAIGKLDIILSTKPKALIDGMSQAQAAVSDFESSVQKSVQRSDAIISSLGVTTRIFSDVSKSAFDSVAGSLSKTSSESDKATAKILSNLQATGAGITDGVLSFNQFRDAATSALNSIVTIAPSASASLTALAGPIGLAIGLVGSLVTAYISYNQNVEENNARIRQNTQNLSNQIAEARSLFEELKNTNNSLRDKKTIMDEINSKYGITLKNLGDEKKLAGEIKAAYDGVIESIKIKFALQSNDDAINKIVKQVIATESLIKGHQESVKEFSKEPGSSGLVTKLGQEIISLGDHKSKLEKELQGIYNSSKDLQDRLLDITFTPKASGGGGGKQKNNSSPQNDLGIDDQILSVFVELENKLLRIRQEFGLFPQDVSTNLEITSAEISALEKALESLSLYGLTPADKGVQDIQDNLSIARIKMEGLKESTDKTKKSLSEIEKLPEEGFFKVESNNQNLTSKDKFTPSTARRVGLNFDYEGGEDDLAKSAAGIALSIDIQSAEETRAAVAALNKELEKQNEILNDSTASAKQKKAAQEQIALLREQISEEKKKGEIATQVTKQVYNAVRERIKAYIAEGVAGLIAKEIGSKGVVGLFTAAAGSAAAIALFDSLVPKLAIGTDYVNSDGLAILHKGEKVVPADVKGGGYSDSIDRAIDVNIYGQLSSFGIKFSNDIATEQYNRIAA